MDDSLTVREQMREALERLGIICDQADSAEAAMRLLENHNYNLAFLDVVMPGTDGYELCRKIKQNAYTRLMPVLMLTSRSSPFDRARGALSGCDSYLTKPITWDTFSQAVDKALMKHFRNDRAQMIARGYRY
ncbi:MAG: response regulator [Lysobacteraceae bacterium]|nr:MAG: response regulator [Xanthomonadaceae bacterium]